MTPITAAASVILASRPAASEVFLVRRSDSLRFFGGYLAFPGGKLSAEDAAVPVWTGQTSTSDSQRVAAVRELFEETGVLLARLPDGSFPPSSEALDTARKALLNDQLSFAHFLAENQLRIHADDLIPAGSLVTPPFSMVRFDTIFFVALLPPGQQTDVWSGELSGGLWATAHALLQRWERGEVPVTPPTVTLLRHMDSASALELPARLAPLLARLDQGAIPPIEFTPGVHMFPLRTVALPPAQYTNAFLVGTGPRWLIDPGAHEPAEQQRLFEAIDLQLQADGPLTGVVVTHWHPDHVGAVQAVAQRYRVPVWAHRATGEQLGPGFRIDHFLDEGDRIDLGHVPGGSEPWHLEVLLTPGHAAGHLAFYDPHYQLLFAADLVSTLTSIVIAPPDGDLGVYLESLTRVREIACRLLLPAHGPPTIRARQVLDEAIAHRARREEQLLAVLGEGPQRLEELTGRLYETVSGSLRILAGFQVQAGLEKLRREGRVVLEAEGEDAIWRLTTALALPR